jgi:hypothetical protein
MLIESPEGRVGQRSIALAPALDVLAGRRIAALDNGKPGAALVLKRAGERLAERTGAIFVGVEQKKTAATPCEAELLDKIAASAEVILTGTAD